MSDEEYKDMEYVMKSMFVIDKEFEAIEEKIKQFKKILEKKKNT